MKEVAVVEKAFAAAREAEAAFRAQYGEPMYCGFAWVNIKPATSKIARVLKERYGARKSYYGGIDVWNPGGSMTQSMDLKEAGARAFADVLRAEGYTAYAQSRAD
jgi:hypothetical protein